MTHVFISYSRHDRNAAEALAAFLMNLAIPVWWDNHLFPGEYFGDKIKDKIQESIFTIVIWSDSSCVSNWVLDEARLAHKFNRLVPLKLQSFSAEKIPLEFRHLHSTDLSDVDAIRRVLMKHGFKLPMLNKANVTFPNPELDIIYKYPVPFFDNVMRIKSAALTDRLQEIRSVIYRDLKHIPQTAYSHNSVSHAVQCTNLATELFYDAISDKLSAEEAFVLGLFCFVHDVGMASRSDMSPESIYRAHNVYAEQYVSNLRVKGLIDDGEAETVGALCLMHNRDLNRAKVYFQPLNPYSIRLSVIFSMFRIADMLDVETQPGEILRIKPEIVSQVIGELGFDPKQRMIRISRGRNIDDDHFTLWKSFFDERINFLNEELTDVEAAVSWEAR